jgi:cytosylglucuronate decarboxylase
MTHDEIRRTPGLFDRAVAGLRAARRAGIRLRVNTVAGPNNFRELPTLQELLTSLGVESWELSSLKLERALDYTARDVLDLDAVVRAVFGDAHAAGRLVPMGKVWCGRTAAERQRYLATGTTPRPDDICRVVRHVRYYDAKNARLYPCSLLPHRLNAESVGVETPVSEFALDSARMRARADYWEYHGPRECIGCSTTAAGYSNELAAGPVERPWAF